MDKEGVEGGVGKGTGRGGLQVTGTPFLPTPSPDGGSRIGNSYLSTFAECPKRWFNVFLRPMEWKTEDGTSMVSEGVAPKHTDPNLSKGRVFHEGMAAWLASGVKDGEDTGQYDLEVALAAVDKAAAACRPEYSDPAQADEDHTTMRALIISYHEAYGPGAAAHDFPEIKVCADPEGHPLVEREFVCDLGYGGYVYTCRADAIVDHLGFLKVFEHKTSTVRGVGGRLRTIHRDSQFTGELFTLAHHFVEHPLNGALCNVVPKDRGANSKWGVAERETTTRTPEQLEQWRVDTVGLLRRIDESVHDYKLARARGRFVEEAASETFPELGEHTGRCYKFNRECEFFDVCQRKGREESVLWRFRPRTSVEREHARLYFT